MSAEEALHAAVDLGDLDALKQAIQDQRVDIDCLNSSKWTPLHKAADAGHTDIVKFLLVRRANKDARNNRSETPLHLACAKGHSEIVEYLLLRKVDLNPTDQRRGWSPLHRAVDAGFVSVVKALLDESGILVDVRDKYGRTPLHLAAQRGSLELVQALLEFNADPNQRTDARERPVDLAEAAGHDGVARELRLCPRFDSDSDAAVPSSSSAPSSLSAPSSRARASSPAPAPEAPRRASQRAEFPQHVLNSPSSLSPAAGRNRAMSKFMRDEETPQQALERRRAERERRRAERMEQRRREDADREARREADLAAAEDRIRREREAAEQQEAAAAAQQAAAASAKQESNQQRSSSSGGNRSPGSNRSGDSGRNAGNSSSGGSSGKRQSRNKSSSSLKTDSMSGSGRLAVPEGAKETTRKSTLIFYKVNRLDATQPLEDGFYDPGFGWHAKSTLRYVSRYSEESVEPKKEVLYVHQGKDPRLASFVAACRDIVGNTDVFPTTRARLTALALSVCARLGGTQQGGSSELLASVQEDEEAPAFSLLNVVQSHVTELKQSTNCNVLFLGELSYGLGRHRAILFKYVADQLDIPGVSLHRSSRLAAPESAEEAMAVVNHGYNVVQLEDGTSFVVDLLFKPSTWLAKGTEGAELYTSLVVPYPDAAPNMNLLNQAGSGRGGGGGGGGGKEGGLKLRRDSMMDELDRDMADPEFDSADLELLEELGRGAYAVVHRCKLSGFSCAVKIISLSKLSAADAAEVDSEIDILRGCRHPNIVHYLGKERKGNLLYIFMEHFPQSLSDIIIKKNVKGKRFRPQEVMTVAKSLAAGLHYLHTHPSGVIIHRDLKSQNLLVEVKDKRLHTIRLCDFGVSKQLLEEADKAATQIGTDFWMAPEVHEGKEAYDEASDIWSFAMVLIEMLTLEHPYHGVARDVAVSQIMRGTLPVLARYQRRFPKAIKLIQFCAKKDPRRRPTALEVLQKIVVLDVT